MPSLRKCYVPIISSHQSLSVYFGSSNYIKLCLTRQDKYVLMTFWMIWPQPGHGMWDLYSFLAQKKHVSRCAVRPWMRLPSRGRMWHIMHGRSRASRPSWLSCKPCNERHGALPLLDVGTGAGRLREVRWEGRRTGSETVLGQSGTSMPSSFWSSGAGKSRASSRQSLYQSLRSAQQRMQ